MSFCPAQRDQNLFKNNNFTFGGITPLVEWIPACAGMTQKRDFLYFASKSVSGVSWTITKRIILSRCGPRQTGQVYT